MAIIEITPNSTGVGSPEELEEPGGSLLEAFGGVGGKGPSWTGRIWATGGEVASLESSGAAWVVLWQPKRTSAETQTRSSA